MLRIVLACSNRPPRLAASFGAFGVDSFGFFDMLTQYPYPPPLAVYAVYIRDHNMAEFAPGFAGGTDLNVLPKNTQPLTNRLVRNGLVDTTVGASAGTTTTVSKSRVVAHTSAEKDTTAIESESLINRASAAADVTALKSKFTKKKPSFGFVRDLSGNGGPAFTRS